MRAWATQKKKDLNDGPFAVSSLFYTSKKHTPKQKTQGRNPTSLPFFPNLLLPCAPQPTFFWPSPLHSYISLCMCISHGLSLCAPCFQTRSGGTRPNPSTHAYIYAHPARTHTPLALVVVIPYCHSTLPSPPIRSPPSVASQAQGPPSPFAASLGCIPAPLLPQRTLINSSLYTGASHCVVRRSPRPPLLCALLHCASAGGGRGSAHMPLCA